MLGFLVKIWFLLFFCVTVALGIELYEHQDPFLPFVPGLECNEGYQCRNNTFVCNSAVDSCTIMNDFKLYVPLAVTSSMFGVILILIFFSSFCVCCARKRLGSVC